MKYKAVIFDLDGTLLNTVDDLAISTNTVLVRHGLIAHPIEDYKYFVGRGIRQLVENVLPHDKHSYEYIQEIYNEVIDEYGRNLDVYTKPYAGIPELLDNLSQKAVRLAILSNKAHEFMADVVKSHFNNWLFEIVFGARKNIPTKPDPYLAFEILHIMKLSKEEVVYVGDSDVDMQTATAAGLFAVGAAWGFRTRKELSDNGAQLIIDRPQDLLQLFN